MNCGQGIELASPELADKEGASVERNNVRMSYIHSWKDFVLCSSLPIAIMSIRVSYRTVLTPISQENDLHRTHSAIWIRDRPGWALFGREDYMYDWLYASIYIYRCRLDFTFLSVSSFIYILLATSQAIMTNWLRLILTLSIMQIMFYEPYLNLVAIYSTQYRRAQHA